jgi:hypothetical protein
MKGASVNTSEQRDKQVDSQLNTMPTHTGNMSTYIKEEAEATEKNMTTLREQEGAGLKE